MDPKSLVKKLAFEIARDGHYGSSENEVWKYSENIINQPLDLELQNALKAWLNAHPSITYMDNKFFASEEDQWLALTGGTKGNKTIGDLAFQLLSLVSKYRKAGISTPEAAKQTQQDPRSIFGRVQSLVELGLVVKVPIILNGGSTSQLYFHTDADDSVQNGVVDRDSIKIDVLNYIKDGPQNLRLHVDVTGQDFSSISGVREDRKRPILRSAIRDLCASNCLQKLVLYDPNFQDRQYLCLKYLNNNFESKPSSDSQDMESEDEEDLMFEEDVKINFDLENAVEQPQPVSCMANTVVPLANQIAEFIRKAEGKGATAIDLNSKLTGREYRKALSKYLDDVSDKKLKTPQELNYLRIIKGIDCKKRMKFYRYFMNLYYATDTNDRKLWGQFPKQQEMQFPSLSAAELSCRKELGGICFLAQNEAGEWLPTFHGDHREAGPKDYLSGTTTDATKKRGRPRKTPKVEPVNDLPVPEPVKEAEGPPFSDYEWVGGKPVEFTQSDLPLLDIVTSVSTNNTTNVSTPPPVVHQPPAIEATDFAKSRRSEIISKIVADHGAVSSGVYLADLYANYENSGSVIDRRTVKNVCDELISKGKLKSINISRRAKTGTIIEKSIIYDPKVVLNPDSDPRVLKLKRDLENNFASAKPLVDRNRQEVHVERQAISEDQRRELQLKTRVVTTDRRQASRRNVPLMRFGPSAAEVLNIDDSSRAQSRGMKISRNSSAGDSTLPPVPASASAHAPVHAPEHASAPASASQPARPHIDTNWLARSVAVYKSLFSKRSSINWTAVCAKSKVSGTECRKNWPTIRDTLVEFNGLKGNAAFQAMVDEFEELFIEQYKAGKIGLLDDEKSAIPFYVDWWMNTPKIGRVRKRSDDLVAMKTQIKPNDHDLVFIDPFAGVQNQQAVVTAEKNLVQMPQAITYGVKYETKSKLLDNELRLRSLIAADEGPTFSMSAAAAELQDLSEPEISSAKQSLESKKVIQWASEDSKTPVGRPYTLGERIKQTLLPVKLSDNFASLAIEAMDTLQSFGNYELRDEISSSESFAVIQAAITGSAIARHNEKFGIIQGGYKSRGIDKHEFECNLELLFNSSLETSKLDFVGLPVSSNRQRPYLWQTRYLTSEGIWNTVALKLVSMVLFRPGIKLQMLVYNLRFALEAIEVREAINCLVESGTLIKMHNGGLMASSGWFRYLIKN